MVKITFICDRCGATRGEANHWWSTAATKQGHFVILAFRESAKKHYCSLSCLYDVLSQWTSKVIEGGNTSAV